MVGGVSPGKGGKTHLDKPVFNSVKEVSNRVNGTNKVGHIDTHFDKSKY
jgi:succinyl-CoA synthetase alpha subunit